MSDGMSFDEALKQANDDMLDDLAHGRPNRYGVTEPDLRGPRINQDPEREPLIFTYPVPWCSTICTDCHALFLVGEIIHPGAIVSERLIEWRCVACFKALLLRGINGLAESFRASVTSADEATRAFGLLADVLGTIYVAFGECFRCGDTTRDEDALGSPCQRDGCGGRYIRT